jgi:hypothetical protein
MKNLFYFFSVSFLKNQLANKIFAFLTLLFLLLPQYACNTTEPPNNRTLLLKLEDVSCTEAWIQFSSTNIQIPDNITLYINNQPKKTINLTTVDTLLYIDSLLPNQTYKILAAMQPYNNASNELSVTTMDTTSHNFTWQSFTFGGIGGSSVLYDVAIIDENNIWAVGEIYMNDSLGRPDPSAYNAVHWDGQRWELKRIYTYSNCSSVDFAPLKSIYAFSYDNIVVTSGGGMWWYNGIKWNAECSINPLLTGAINKLWGSSSEDLYAVGNNGNIAHYQNGSWSKIESGTSIALKDICGTPDGKEIWTCGWNYQTGQSMIQKITESASGIIWDSEVLDPKFVFSGLINSICSNGNSEFVFVGGQVYRQSLLDGRLAKREWINTVNGSNVLELGNYGYRIKSSNKNNIAVVGDAAMIWHYNGSTWYKFTVLYNEEDRLYGLAIIDNLIVAVGKRYVPGTLGLGLIIIGRR